MILWELLHTDMHKMVDMLMCRELAEMIVFKTGTGSLLQIIAKLKYLCS